MNIQFYKYHGTGNDFIIIDNRDNHFPKENTALINMLCDRHFGVGADGLILLENSDKYNFKMVYFNANGNKGTMCGNGGRCLVAFANQLNVIDKKAVFEAVDGLHNATFNNGIVSLQMRDVTKIENHKSYLFLNTGSPHHVKFVSDISKIDVKKLGEKIRYGAPYFKEGTNVNFAEVISKNKIKVRTYERGVEDETLSCGTGVTAVVIASNILKKTTKNIINIDVLGGELTVSFEKENDGFKNIFLTGSASFIFKGVFEIKN